MTLGIFSNFLILGEKIIWKSYLEHTWFLKTNMCDNCQIPRIFIKYNNIV